MGRNARIALAVGIGYLLGRRRKLRAALVLGAAAAAGRVSTDPQALRRLLPSDELGRVTGLGKPLAAAGKAAATAAVSHGIDSVGGRMRRQADALRGAGERGLGGLGKPERGEEHEEERDRAEGAREERVRKEPSEDRYEKGQQEEEQAPEPEPRRRAKAGRPAGAGRPRKRAAEEEGREAAGQPPRGGGRERPETGGAPVRRRGR